MAFIWETPEEIDLALAKRLTLIRKRRGFSQQQLSERSNVSFGSIKLQMFLRAGSICRSG